MNAAMLVVCQSLGDVARACVDKPAELLTENERVALAFVAGCEFTTELVDGGRALRITTKNPIGIVKIDGNFRVAECASRAGDRLTI